MIESIVSKKVQTNCKKNNGLLTLKMARAYHLLIAETLLNRNLYIDECVHHIDGNELNKSLCHYSLQNCVANLYKQRIIGFNSGSYSLRSGRIQNESNYNEIGSLCSLGI